MKTNDFFKIANIKIYKVDTKVKNDYILLDLSNDIYYNETTLGKCYDILLEKYPQLFFYLLLENSPSFRDDSEVLLNNGIFDIKLFKNIKLDFMKSKINSGSKLLFEIFREHIFTGKLNVYNLTFIPMEKRIIEIHGLNYFNIYKNKCPFSNLKAKTNQDFYHIEFLLRNILQVGYDYFINFLSWKIKYPLEPIDCHFVIQDDGGTGKTKILSNILSKLINSVTISQEDIDSSFNSYMVNALCVICEEIEAYDNEKKLKYLTGVGGTIRINEKGKGEYDIMNYTNWFLLSNDKKSIKISDKDRRFIIVGGGKRLSPLSDGDWSKTLFKDMDDNHKFFDSEKGYHKNFDKEIKNFYQYLLSINVKKRDLLINLPTTKKDELIKLNYTSEQEFINELISLGIDNLIKAYGKFTDTSKFLIRVDEENSVNFGYWIKSQNFYDLYCSFCKMSNMRPIQKINFFRRLNEFHGYITYFEGVKTISFHGEKFWAIKINDGRYKDENNNIKPEKVIEVEVTKNTKKKKEIENEI